MLIELAVAQMQNAVVGLSALAAASVILALAWPWIVPNVLGQRMRAVERDRLALRRRELSSEAATMRQRSSLFLREPNRILAATVNLLGLSQLSDESNASQLLRMAGQRGRAPLVAFLALRLIMAVTLPGVSIGYSLLVLGMDMPLIAILGIALVSGMIGFMLPKIYITNLIAKRQNNLRRNWPDALDLLLICVESGMSIEVAFRKVAEEIGTQSPELAEEMSLTTAELAYLTDRRQAYANLGKRTGLDSVKAAVIGLIQSEKYGTSLGKTLRVLAQESRDFRMSAAEKKAAALPPKLTVPMILFFLPVLFAVIAAPAVIQALGAS